MSDSIELAPTPASVAMARRWSEQVLARMGADGLADTVNLLVSELVSNVVLHAGTSCSLAMTMDGARLHVEVRDASNHLPEPVPSADPLASSGRGLLLVSGLSESFGIDPEPKGGKRVWFELAVP
jgi:anti-sigma regulatory factor (Ser/Thr protein kinase)